MSERIVRVGDRVRLRADFLRNTGQYSGPEPFKKWTVLAIDRDFVTVDEPSYSDPTKNRLINVANLEVIR